MYNTQGRRELVKPVCGVKECVCGGGGGKEEAPNFPDVKFAILPIGRSSALIIVNVLLYLQLTRRITCV